jgi:agmatine deiminase
MILRGPSAYRPALETVLHSVNQTPRSIANSRGCKMEKIVTTLLTSTPNQDGFRMPGEFEQHDGCWMLWPERSDTFRMGAKPAQKAYTETAIAISRFEPVTMGVSAGQFINARNRLPAHIRVIELSYNDAWMRDNGPIFVNNGHEVRVVDWEFNAWGGLEEGLYFPWDQDNLVPRKVAEIERMKRYKAPMVLEGGGITVDGAGTLITTAQCLLNPNRNPHLSQTEIETYLQNYLAIEKVIWLPRGSVDDETDGHVDGLCAYIRPGEVVLSWTDDNSSPEYDIVREAYEQLQAATDAQGQRLTVHKLHNPSPIYVTAEESDGIDLVDGTLPRPEGMYMGGSYVNFYLANGGVVVPLYGDPADEPALATLQALMPERTVVGVSGGREILLGGGMVHCITQQQPSPKSK